MPDFPEPKHKVIDARGLSLAIDDIFFDDEKLTVPTVFATVEEAVAGVIDNRVISPATLNEVLNNEFRTISIASYPSFDPENISIALQEAIDDITAEGGGSVLIPPGEWTAKSTVTIATDNISIFSQGHCLINLHVDIGVGLPLFDVALRAATVTATVTTDIVANSTTIVVDDATGINPGDHIEWRSDGEYWNGIAGVGGFRIEYKSEGNRVKFVTGNTLTTEGAIWDSYDATNHTVTLTVVPKWKHVNFFNLKFQGNGIEGGPKVANLRSIEELTLSNIDAENCLNGMIQIEACTFWSVDGGWIRGYDLSDPDEETYRAGGYNIVGSCHGMLRGLRGTGLRRLVNFDASSGSIIPRHIVAISCIAEKCLNGIGTHYVDDLAIVNCIFTNAGIYYRGKNPTIIGCTIVTTGVSQSTGTIFLGNDQAWPYSETPSLGIVNFQFNRLISNNNGISSLSSIEGGVISNNVIESPFHGIRLTGKETKNLLIANNNIRRNGGDTDGHYGVWFRTAPNNVRESLHDILLTGNVYNGWNVPIRIEGCADPSYPAYNIIAQNEVVKYDIDAGTVEAVMFGDIGYYGKNIGVRNSFVFCPLSSGMTLCSGENSKFQVDFFDDGNWYPGGKKFKTVFRTSGAAPSSRHSFDLGDCYEVEPVIAGYPRRFVAVSAGTMGAGGFPSVTGSITAADSTLTFNTDPNLTSAGVVTNNCSSTTGWTIGTGWAHATTKFTHTADADVSVANLSLAVTGLTAGEYYRIKATVTDFGTGSNYCGIYMTGATVIGGQQIISANGDYYVNFYADNTTATLTFTPNRLFAGSIDNVEIDQVTFYVFPGTYVNIPGAGVAAAALATKVVSMTSPLVWEVETAASTTVTGQTITQKAPTFVGIDVAGWADAPASASATGRAGTVAKDATRLYICTATNTWLRSAEFTTW